jgi:hypothetical protein
MDGSIIALAVPSLIQIYQKNGGSWTELGDGIPVQSALSKVSLSPSIVSGFNGITLAVSEWDWEGTEGSEQGRTTVYSFVESPETGGPESPPTPPPTFPPDGNPTFAPTSPPSPVPTSEPTFPPTDPPTDSDPTPTDSDPTPTGSPAPTNAPAPTSPPFPTPPCETGHIEFKLEVTTDLYPEDLTWTIQKQGDETDILEGGPYTDAFTKFTFESCIPSEGCYQFRFSDQNQDGPCCLYGEGGFTMLLDGEVRATFNYSDTVNGVSSEWFGDCSF